MMSMMKKILRAYTPGTCRSFMLDITLLLPLVGLLVEMLARKISKKYIRQVLYVTIISLFIMVSGSLYFDLINFYFLTVFLGHPEAWSGNHFMWNSGIEVLGFRPIIDTTTPTYTNFWGFWNIFAMVLFFVIYPTLMIKTGRRLHGLLFGYTTKQTGISALFFERKNN